jgi:hypothetical protein
VVTVKFSGSWVHGLEIGLEAILWAVVIGLLLGRRRSRRWWSGRISRKNARHARLAYGSEPPTADSAVDAVAPGASGSASESAPAPA